MNKRLTVKTARLGRSIVAAGLVGTIVLSGCSERDRGSTGSATTTTAAETPTASTDPAAPSTGESIDWEPCGDLECGTVAAPVDPEDLTLGTLEIAVNVHRATSPNERVGYLFVNPGGPGESGLELAAQAEQVLGAEVASRFDVVGFDPRGVGMSEPTFECGNGPEQRELLQSLSLPLDDAEVAAGEKAARLCVDSMGPVANRLGTAYVAHDIVYEAFKAGARGFVTKDAGSQALLAAIRAAAGGEGFASPDVTVRLIRHYTAADRRPIPHHITERERDLLIAVASGLTNEEIAAVHHVSLSTVKSSLS
jgi:DNA-binding NarL/FixJ family response regulator